MNLSFGLHSSTLYIFPYVWRNQQSWFNFFKIMIMCIQCFFEESVILNILKNECGMCMDVMIKGTHLLCVETPTVYNWKKWIAQKLTTTFDNKKTTLTPIREFIWNLYLNKYKSKVNSQNNSGKCFGNSAVCYVIMIYVYVCYRLCLNKWFRLSYLAQRSF